MKTLIAYFSRAGQNYVRGNIVNLPVGNTQVIAEKLHQQITDAKLFHIESAEGYSDDYMTCTEEAKQELRENARPALKADLSPDEYDTIILGYPNWWGTMPMAVKTWLDSHDFKGKKIVPFCTHEGSGLGHSVSDLRKALTTADVIEGVAIHGSDVAMAEREVNKIVESANN